MTDRGGKTMTEAPVTDLDLAEVERLLEAPQGLVETVALARVVRPLLSTLKAERERAAQAWRPIETAPNDGTEVLLCLDNGLRIVGQWRDSIGWHDGFELAPLRKSTHWQPLPSPPGDRT
jgi:hypothetical protein